MPELPEVETIKRDLLTQVKGQTIRAVHVYDRRVIRNCSEQNFQRQLNNQAITDIDRRGKAIIMKLSGGRFLVVQPMMTGQLVFHPASLDVPGILKETKIIFDLSKNGSLRYNDQRLFGRLTVVAALDEIEYFKTIGPEPFDRSFNPQWMGRCMAGRAVPIKTLLLDHRFVAGIGNIYASEILFGSRIHPKRKARSLKPEEIERLYQKTCEVLEEAVRWRGTSMRNYRDGFGEKGNFINRIKVYGREKESCPECRGPISKIVLNGRSTFFCKRCQH